MPDADGEAAARGVRHAIPVHVPARLLHDPGYEAEAWACLAEVVEGEATGCADEGAGVCRFEEFVDLRMGDVVGEQYWGYSVERACYRTVSTGFAVFRSSRRIPKIAMRYSVLLGR